MEQVADYGASLVRFIAAQNAVAALAEDWPAVVVIVHQIMKTGDFRSVTVIDRAGVVRASGDAALVGQAYRAPVAESLGLHDGAVALTRHFAGGEPVLGFATSITFQNKPVGRVVLALPERSLLRVAQISAGCHASPVDQSSNSTPTGYATCASVMDLITHGAGATVAGIHAPASTRPTSAHASGQRPPSEVANPQASAAAAVAGSRQTSCAGLVRATRC